MYCISRRKNRSPKSLRITKAEVRAEKSLCRNRYSSKNQFRHNSKNQFRKIPQIWVLKTVATGMNCSKVII